MLIDDLRKSANAQSTKGVARAQKDWPKILKRVKRAAKRGQDGCVVGRPWFLSPVARAAYIEEVIERATAYKLRVLDEGRWGVYLYGWTE